MAPGRCRTEGIAAYVEQALAISDPLCWRYGAEKMQQLEGVADALASKLRDEPFGHRRGRQRLLTQLSTLLQDYYQWERNVDRKVIVREPRREF